MVKAAQKDMVKLKKQTHRWTHKRSEVIYLHAPHETFLHIFNPAKFQPFYFTKLKIDFKSKNYLN